MSTRRDRTRSSGFTLIELMIVVAILGILAAMAIPQFMRFQLRTKAGEGKLNLTAIRIAQTSYFGEFGTYIHMPPQPSSVGPAAGVLPGGTKRQWAACPAVLTLVVPERHCVIGYFPEGPTYFDYAVGAANLAGAVNDPPGPAPFGTNTQFFADAVSDIDSNGITNNWGLRVPLPGDEEGVNFSAAALNGCLVVVDEFGNPNVFGSIGPCSLQSGTTSF